MTTKTKKITLSLNPKQPCDALLLTAVELAPGNAAAILKLLAIRGASLNSDFASSFVQAVSIFSEASDERQLLLPVNDNYNSRFITSLGNSKLRVLERQRKQKEPAGRLAFPLPHKHFTHAPA